MHDALADRSQVLYDPYTPEQQQGIRRQLEKFVAAQVSEIFLEIFRQQRRMLHCCCYTNRCNINHA